jgi:prepilin-type processing-associated H-X9-DG protein/prepilin-type N-terminal cleavage/methylation domain-containing protein
MKRNFRKNNRKQRRTFTLVELLVVIAILSILSSLLMPLLSRAMNVAKSTACMNNLKQCGLALRLYADDFALWLPTAIDYNYASTVEWGEMLAEKYDYLADGNVCVCPSAKPFKLHSASPFAFTYGLPAYNADEYHRMNFRRMKLPAQMEILIDTVRSSGAYSGWQCCLSSRRADGGSTSRPHLRHQGKANVVFGDGHGTSIGAGSNLSQYWHSATVISFGAVYGEGVDGPYGENDF